MNVANLKMESGEGVCKKKWETIHERNSTPLDNRMTHVKIFYYKQKVWKFAQTELKNKYKQKY